MSHTTTIRSVTIKDVAALRSAVADLQAQGVNVQLKENARARMYYEGQSAELGNLPFVLHLPNSRFDVGFQAQPDGSYTPVFDEWDNQVHTNIGAACAIPETDEERAMWAIGNFAQLYAKHAAINAAQAQGYMVEEVTYDQQGNLHLSVLAA